MNTTTITPQPTDSAASLRPVAIAMFVASLLWILIVLAGIGVLAYGDLANPTLLIGTLIPIVPFNMILLYGSICMLRRTSYMWSFVACWLSLVPACGPLYLVGIPLGIWGIAVLRRSQVRDAFQYM